MGTTTYVFGLFAEGADLSVASTVEQLERAGYTHPAAVANSGVQALVFSRRAQRLADAVSAVVAAAESISGLRIARQARSGSVAVFHADSLEFATACVLVMSTEPHSTAQQRARHRSVRCRQTDTHADAHTDALGAAS
ncbi:hypothetical protein [Candidatus Poriferisodalis sp.]|uniref:hypothetical protein n=1 Tax=Candidatus Poriferisodalis sp. TaxID=3101277 RepID=UPI003B010748